MEHADKMVLIPHTEYTRLLAAHKQHVTPKQTQHIGKGEDDDVDDSPSRPLTPPPPGLPVSSDTSGTSDIEKEDIQSDSWKSLWQSIRT